MLLYIIIYLQVYHPAGLVEEDVDQLHVAVEDPMVVQVLQRLVRIMLYIMYYIIYNTLYYI